MSGTATTEHRVLLLVEDDPDQAFMVRCLLADCDALGTPIVHLGTAAAAEERLAAGDVTCVVLDLSLPDARGMEALHRLRAVDARVPIVVLTAFHGNDVGLAALQGGAQDFLVKGQHAHDAIPRSVLFAIERARREEAERIQTQLSNRLQMREVQLSEAQRLARIGSWEWDLVTGDVVWSTEMSRLTGITEVGGVEAFERYLALVDEEDRADAARLFSAEAADDPPVVAQHRLLRADGTRRWIHGRMTAAGWDDAGQTVRVLGTMQDITEQKDAEDLLAHQALHDLLTGLANRGVLLDRLARVLESGRDSEALVAVVFLDLDRFKWINDSRSHGAGDRLLVSVARALEHAVRPTDTLARFGGDEFVILCESVRDEDDVLQIAQRLAAAVRGSVGDSDPELQGVDITASIGVATARPGTGVDPELLVRDADIAMYRAKERGRARFEVFDEGMRARATARLQTQSELIGAVRGNQMLVHYQPVVDVRTGVVTGTEALVRWAHPKRGLLMPVEFIPHAEESGLIVDLGADVLRASCMATARWNASRHDPLTVAVNLSARQLADPHLPDIVASALRASALPPHLLCLEVTETVVMDDPAASALVLGELRELGVRVAIDDFGTGFSSLAYLMSLPVDLLKVDRSFVSALDAGPGAAIVTTVLALAATLDLGVVAEGVETVGQRGRLLDLGVTAAQGWLWGAAVAAGEAAWARADGAVAGPPLVITLPEPRPPLDTGTKPRL